MDVGTPTTPTQVNSPFKRRKQLEQDIAHVTEEMYRRNKELADTNRILSLLQTIDSLILTSREPLKEISNQIAAAIISHTDYQFVAVLAHRVRRDDTLEVFGWSGGKDFVIDDNTGALINAIQIKTSNGWLQSSQQNRLLQLDGISSDQLANALDYPLSSIESIKAHLPFKSLHLIKLSARQKLVGLIAIGFSSPMTELYGTDKLLLDRLSEAVGVAVDNKLLFEENQLIVHELQQSNDKLKALDETKDEFISMASHQLRTPLTAVKGYLSMVIEGDAGKVDDKQKPMLNQAFNSAQRMVYLIADLLNVSRLKTGKFVIESQPSQLADVVEAELAQLTETAKARNLKLIYNKPANFPLLNLDETKIRQVIMNFVDNAIYYTPAGGAVTVELKDLGETIQLTVTDTGIGVPKADQPHLFSKFYRAGNAQKARPDGTGLGLFMARKVVTAQGGTIVFKSDEGKGSTFGFTFPKQKLQTEVPNFSTI